MARTMSGGVSPVMGIDADPAVGLGAVHREHDRGRVSVNFFGDFPVLDADRRNTTEVDLDMMWLLFRCFRERPRAENSGSQCRV